MMIIWIICSIIILLLMPQIVWIQDNKSNPYLTVFDRLPFRIIITILAGSIIGLLYSGFIFNIIKSYSEARCSILLKKLAISHIPLIFLLLLPFRIEIGYQNLVNCIIFYGSILVYYILLEINILIPVTLINLKNKLRESILIICFFVLTLLFFAPVQIFLTNPGEFFFQFTDLIRNFFIISILVFIIIYRIFLLFNFESKGYKLFLLITFALGLCLLIQGNFFVWHYGSLNGSKIDWGNYFIFGLIDGFVWCVLIISPVLMQDFIYSNLKKNGIWICLIFILFQFFLSLFLTIQQYSIIINTNNSSFRNYTVDENKKFVFSKETNVIVLITDEFQTDIFLGNYQRKTRVL